MFHTLNTAASITLKNSNVVPKKDETVFPVLRSVVFESSTCRCSSQNRQKEVLEQANQVKQRSNKLGVMRKHTLDLAHFRLVVVEKNWNAGEFISCLATLLWNPIGTSPSATCYIIHVYSVRRVFSWWPPEYASMLANLRENWIQLTWISSASSDNRKLRQQSWLRELCADEERWYRGDSFIRSQRTISEVGIRSINKTNPQYDKIKAGQSLDPCFPPG